MTELAKLHSKAPGGNFDLRCSQFATWAMEEGTIGVALVSFVGPQTAVKSLAAALNQNCKLTVNCNGEPFSFHKDYVRIGNQGSYAIRSHKLPYNTVHCTAMMKAPGFLPCVTEEAVWRELSSTRFTTPIIREWMPWLMREMADRKALYKLRAFQCEPGMLVIDSKGLDELVSNGVRRGKLRIRKGAA